MTGGFGDLAFPLGGDSGWIDVYAEQLLRLLPPGIGFSRDDGSNVADLCARMSYELARVRERAEYLITDANPLTTIELLPEWEEALGLPTTCYAPTTIDERQAAVVARLAGSGNHALSDYQAIATALGYGTITAATFPPFVAGSVAGDALTNDPWANTVEWTIPTGAVDSLLECAFNAKRRSHTTHLFDFV